MNTFNGMISIVKVQFDTFDRVLYTCTTNGWFETLIGALYRKSCFDTSNDIPYVIRLVRCMKCRTLSRLPMLLLFKSISRGPN